MSETIRHRLACSWQPQRRTSSALLLVMVALACNPGRPEPPASDPTAMRVRAVTIAALDSLNAATAALHEATLVMSVDTSATARLQAAFVRARAAYKRAELWIEAYLPLAAEQLNGPPIDDVDLGEGPMAVMPAHGFQVLEELLYPAVQASRMADIEREAAWIQDYAGRSRVFADSTVMRDTQLFDAVRLEIARIATFGITGFDSPVRRGGLAEAAWALDGVVQALEPYRARLNTAAPGVVATADSLVASARVALRHGNFDDFDRLGFITQHTTPLAHIVAAWRDSLHIAAPREPRLWRASAPSPFDANAFDAEAPCAACEPPLSAARASLGQRLFFDGALSGSGTRSCATCHQPGKAFTDGQVTSAALTTGVRLRNAPSLINAALQWAQFTDMRAEFLEDQAADVVASPVEMHGALDVSVSRFRRDSSYQRAFRNAFPGLGDSALSAPSITVALAAYVRSLTSLESRADAALRGDTARLTATERRGFNVFAGKGRCATCHFLPLTNGTVPPLFIRTETEVLGVPATARWSRATVDVDPGRGGVTKAPLQQHAFKTPALRNVALTAPYMHNGVYRTLEEVVRFYDAGGGTGIGIHLPNQTLPGDSLRLARTDQQALVAFLRALIDSTLTSVIPVATASAPGKAATASRHARSARSR